MQIGKLEHLIEVAKTESISLASQNLHSSQSGISQSIARIEDELGIEIFKRTRFGVIPTEKGKIIINKANEVLMKYQELLEAAGILNSSISCNWQLSATPIWMTQLLYLVLSYNKTYPNVNIEISEKKPLEIINDVLQNKIEFGLIQAYQNTIPKNEKLIFEVLLEKKMKVYVGQNSPLLHLKKVTPNDLINYSLVLYNDENILRFTNNFFIQHQPMNILLTSNNPEIIKKSVAEGLAISFAPGLMRTDPYVLNGEIVPLEISDYEAEHISLGYIRLAKKELSNITKEFLQLIKTRFKNGIELADD
ncbi:LysR family transcriptional regulator [Bacillus sp. AFS002410]|uniref:LysR family transcriptional regulator n=1 Tax=Bacillus sp. AFS002410 TaxID=2033481 RepID=UPI000BF21FE5|nr:LysR family transcriptional regulator [Bacillus sp. AFS002410]PEJ60848.1 LysR family transcriptional regulator [Bacillus sp. AFS002410]